MGRAWQSTATMVIATAVAVTGCAQVDHSAVGRRALDVPRSTTGRPVRVAPKCVVTRAGWPGRPGRLTSGPLPTNFHAVALLSCQTDDRTLADGSQWSYLVTKRGTQDLDALVAALDEPDDPPPTGDVACAASYESDPDIILIGSDGAAYRPRFPRGVCDVVKPDAIKALGRVPLHTVETQRLQQVVSALSARTGCEDAWKDMLAIEGAGASDTIPPAAGQRIKVCLYRVSAQLVPPRPGYGGTPVGRLVAGRLLTSAASARLTSAISAAPVAPACSRRHTRYVVLTGTDWPGSLYLELDGCRRIAGWDRTFHVLTADVANDLGLPTST
jgi:hypothetical protein